MGGAKLPLYYQQFWFWGGGGGGGELELYCHEKLLAPSNYVGTMSGLLKKCPIQVLHAKTKIQDYHPNILSTDTHKAGNRVNQRHMSWIRYLG